MSSPTPPDIQAMLDKFEGDLNGLVPLQQQLAQATANVQQAMTAQASAQSGLAAATTQAQADYAALVAALQAQLPPAAPSGGSSSAPITHARPAEPARAPNRR